VPGSAFIYSVSTDVLGGVLQAAMGQSLPEVMRSLITEPLGIRDTGFAVTDDARLATPYVNDEPEPRRLADDEILTDPNQPEVAGARFTPSRIFDPASFPSGGSGMAGTAGGVLTLLEAIRLDASDGAARLLARPTARSLFTGQIGALEIGPGTTVSFAGAVVIDPVAAGTPQSAGTLSWGGAYGHTWSVDPERELSVVTVTNTIPEGANGQFVADVRDAIYGA
jgi:CubicO group peptidase (beta-lactamase class C family)